MQRPCLDHLEEKKPGMKEIRTGEQTAAQDLLASIAWLGDNAGYGIIDPCRETIDKAIDFIETNDMLLGEMVRKASYTHSMLKRYEVMVGKIEQALSICEEKAKEMNVSGGQVVEIIRTTIRSS